jgi:propionyl-CoA synthetase
MRAILVVCKCIGPVAAFKTAIVVKRLLKTRSGKILQGAVYNEDILRLYALL